DMDSVINGDVFGALPSQADVVVYDRPGETFAHQMINCGFIATTPRGKDFIDFIAAHILHFEAAELPKWFDDQFAVVVAREWFQRNVPDMSIAAAPRQMMDWSRLHRADSL